MAIDMAKDKSVRAETAQKIGLFTGLAMTARILRGIAIGVLLLCLLSLAVPYVKGARDFKLIDPALKVERAIESFVQKKIPPKFAGKGVVLWVIIGGALALSAILQTVHDRFHDKAENLRLRMSYDKWRTDVNLADDALVLSPLKHKIEHLASAKQIDREELLQIFAKVKKQLDEMDKKYLAFLSVDVVDSMGMKKGEEPASVEHDFAMYKRFVEELLDNHECLKATWTPDGVMSCFETVDAAVKAAREIILGLEKFNGSVKTIQRDFQVRCGVNAGYVYYDADIPLETISHPIIDISGHMQKSAMPNTVCIAQPAIEPLHERNGFHRTGRMVDGYEVYEWKKSQTPV